MSDIFEYGHDPIYPRSQPRDSGAFQLGPFQVETTQRHTYGRRLLTWDGKVYKYSLSSGACRTYRGARHMDVIGTVGIDWVILTVTNAIGDREITVTSAVAQAINSLAGGTMIISDEAYPTPTDGQLQMRTIVRNTPCGAGGATVITLDYPLNQVTTAATYIWCMPSMYRNIAFGTSGTGKISMAGIPAAYVSATGYNFWTQTWGPASCAVQGNVGKHAHARQLVWRYDGSMDYHGNEAPSGGTTTTMHQQHAGYILDNNASDNGASIVMLQMSI